MPSPREAAAILRQRFRGFSPGGVATDRERIVSPQTPTLADMAAPDDEPIIGDPTGALQLSALRNAQSDELSQRFANNESASFIPTEGYAQGDPGRRVVSNVVPAANALSDKRALQQLERDAAADPFTGDAERARVAGMQDVIDKAALTSRSEVGDAAKAVATRNAFADYMKSKGMKMGEYEAASSPAAVEAAKTKYYADTSDVGQHALDAANARDIQRSEAMKGALFGDLGQGTPTAPQPKLTAQEQALMDSAATTEQLAPEMLKLLEAERPGIADDPTKFGSWTDVLPAVAGAKIYSLGVTQNENRARINQLTGYLEASLPRMLAAGRINQQQYADLKMHTPQLGLSDGANYERTRYILSKILPAVVGGVAAGHGVSALRPAAGRAPVAAAGGASPIDIMSLTDPNWGK